MKENGETGGKGVAVTMEMDRIKVCPNYTITYFIEY